MDNLLPGTTVTARGLRWDVVFSQRLGPQTLYRLRALEGSLKGNEFDLLSPFENISPIAHELCPQHAAPLRNWLVYTEAFLLEQSLGLHAFLAVQPGRLRMEPYQLVPVLRALTMSRVRLLLADGVGLGKTIQAGLVITELIARRIAHRILLVSPAGPLLEQWKLEMSERFGLRFSVIDRARLEEIRKDTELGANPFDHIALGLVSMDFLKQERVLEQLERSSYDVVVLDEAHHYTDLGGVQDRDDSQRRRLATVLAHRSDTLLLLTATPHDGNDRSFASLCELLDPSLVDGRGALRGDIYRDHVIRRLKNHIQDPHTGRPLFRQRQVLPCPVSVPQHNRYYQLNKTLLDFIAPELRRAFRTKHYSDVLSFIALLKRSVSTVEACRSTLEVVAERFQHLLTEKAESQESRRQRVRTLQDFQRKLERFGTVSPEEEEERELLEAEDLAQKLADMQRELRSEAQKLTRVATVIQTLDELIRLAREASAEDPKLAQIAAEVRHIRTAEATANILIYTEYTTSQDALVDYLKHADLGEILKMRGEDNDQERKQITDQFRTRDRLILVSTDAAAEGLNLHQRCHHLIHLELPFNPNRLEQRNGRIDRYGQQHDPMVRYLFLRGTFEERILLRLIVKYERQRARLTFVPNTLGLNAGSDAGIERLLKGIMDDDTRLFRSDDTLFDFGPETARENQGVDAATKEILEEIDNSLSQYQKATNAHAWLADAGLNAEQRLVREVEQARGQGERASLSDLASFVANAVLLNGGKLHGQTSDQVFTLVLPPGWNCQLQEMAGYDVETHSMRLTTSLEVYADEQGPVGFLGRAHPLVQRALQKVRSLCYGFSDQERLDPRVSAVKADVAAPTLLYTMLGRVQSKAGRELEQMVAVQIDRDSQCRVYLTAGDWLHLADADNATSTGDVWQTHFAGWAESQQNLAIEQALAAFAPLADAFVSDKRRLLEDERQHQHKWLQTRADEISGPVAAKLFTQPDLFESAAKSQSAASWGNLSAPDQRLAAFAADPAQTAGKRSEAEGVLRIYRRRLEDLHARLELGKPEVIVVGMLMIVPEMLLQKGKQ